MNNKNKPTDMPSLFTLDKGVFIALLGVILYCPPLYADISISANQLQKLRECSQAGNAEQKASCYEKHLLPLLQQPKKEANPPTTVETSTHVESTNSLGEKYLSRKNTSETSTPQQFNLVKITKDKYKRWRFYFANGQVWQQLEADYFSKPKQFPVGVTIATGAMGSFNLNLENSKKIIKVKRVQ